jgi:hypothetical protein
VVGSRIFTQNTVSAVCVIAIRMMKNSFFLFLASQGIHRGLVSHLFMWCLWLGAFHLLL